MNAETFASIEGFLSLAEGQESFHRTRLSQSSNDPEEADAHSRLAGEFSRLANFLRNLQDERPDAPQATGLLALTAEDLEGLPEEVINELNVSKASKLHFTILELAESNGGRISLDHIIIGVYRKTGVVLKRPKATNVVYKMMNSKLLYSIPGVKAGYSMTEVTNCLLLRKW